MKYMLPLVTTDEILFKHISLNKPVQKDTLVNYVKTTNRYSSWVFRKDLRYKHELTEFERKLANGLLEV